MKIGSTPDIPGTGSTAGVQKPAQPATTAVGGAAKAPAADAAEKVTVSTLARSLEAAEADGMDMEKVSAVKAAIAQGTYKINAEAIADRLLANAEELLQPRQR
jgi:negative regulator of flagellin synthesis FlgM